MCSISRWRPRAARRSGSRPERKSPPSGVRMNRQALSTAAVPSKPTWREVSGVVLHSGVEFAGDTYLPVIRYEYGVDGVTYRGDTIVAGLITYNWKGPAERLVDRFPVGAKVPVFVDPGNPRK